MSYTEDLLKQLVDIHINNENFAKQTLDQVDASADNNSKTINAHGYRSASLQVISSVDAADATVKLQGSNNGTDWADMVDVNNNAAEVTLPSGAGDSCILITNYFKHIRIVYTKNSVTSGTVDYYWHGKS